MTTIEVENFKSTYKMITQRISEIGDCKVLITKFSNWDKNGSHKNAILNAQKDKNEVQKELNILLNGKSIEEWKNTYNALNYFLLKIKKAHQKIEEASKEIEKIQL